MSVEAVSETTPPPPTTPTPFRAALDELRAQATLMHKALWHFVRFTERGLPVEEVLDIDAYVLMYESANLALRCSKVLGSLGAAAEQIGRARYGEPWKQRADEAIDRARLGLAERCECHSCAAARAGAIGRACEIAARATRTEGT